MHAETLKSSISAVYSYPTRPLQLSYLGNGLKCEFTLATIGEYRGGSATPVPQMIGASSTQTPTNASTREVPPQEVQRQPSESMPPPVEPASRSFTRPLPSHSQRSSPPLPNASLDPDSLFLPAEAENDDRLWGERTSEDEDDMLGWDSNANTVSVRLSWPALPDANREQGAATTSFATDHGQLKANSKLEPFKSRFDDELRVAPTQKLSEVRESSPYSTCTALMTLQVPTLFDD